MKRKYEEQYKTCIFISRISFFVLLASDSDIKEEDQLSEKIDNILKKNKLYKQRNEGFLGRRFVVSKKDHLFTNIFVALGFTEFCPIFSIPGCYAAFCANPKKIYQKWCDAFHNKLTSEEIETVLKACHRENNEWDEYGELAWNRMKEQERYSWKSELRSIYYFWKKKFFSN